ncbi:MAG: iron ABC transporter permease [Abditibacteriales bacterium]|nr:iron ABC transporter permease [Abditibacteriales bacterium]
MRRYDLTPSTLIFLAFLFLFFFFFLALPLLYVFQQAFFDNGRPTLTFFVLMLKDPVRREAIVNSINIAALVTIFTTLVTVPLAYLMVRCQFRGRGWVEALLLVPMVLPPFVGAIGMRQIFARFGSVNLLLMEWGVISENHPIDWFGGGFWGVIILEVLHLYPIMYLNIAAALANVDPSLEEAAENIGASGFKLFRTITFPLMLPGFFAGATVVFIWAFTELGTPLVFEYRQVVPVQIFDMVSDIHANPVGYAMVVLVIAITMVFFYLAKRTIGARRYEMIARGHVGTRTVTLRGWKEAAALVLCLSLIGVALLPHISVVLTSIAQRWFMTVLPQETTLKFYGKVFTHELTLPSIKNSLFYASLSTVIDLLLGIAIAYLLTRKRVPFANLIDATAMLPLALPGLVIAFGYMATFSSGVFANTFLNPLNNPTVLLIIAYAVRRLPYSVRAAYAGFQQTSVTLEEASLNLGASPMRTLARITLPLVMANLIAGAILAFSFAMLEVSDSLILALREPYYPIAKAIYELLARIGDGPFIASAMGILGMVLLTVSLMLAGKFLGKRMGELFRAG